MGPGGYNPVGPGVSLAGGWGPVFHEDQHERGPGPELVNYLGIPLTDGARMYGLAWDAVTLHNPRTPVRSSHRLLYLPRTV